jgi:hypothetical protein
LYAENKPTMMASFDRKPTGQRIPKALQAVFLASNRGQEVHKPPPNNTANKVFVRNWFFQRSSTKKRESHVGPRLNSGSGGRNAEKEKENVGSGLASPKIPCYEVAPAISVPAHQQNPQKFLTIMLKARGYSIEPHRALLTAFFNAPTFLQKASYHAHVVELVKGGDLKRLQAIMSSGISPNPCNKHGESLLHLTCRLGKHEALNIMIENGTRLQVCDAMGRTPLHDACWGAEPCFVTIDTLLRQDPSLLLMADDRGACPLYFAGKDQWGAWLDFLYQKRDQYWPRRIIRFEGTEKPALFTQMKEHSRPIPSPPNALTPELAGFVVSGRMHPKEVRALFEGDDTSATESVTAVAEISLGGRASSMDDCDSDYISDSDSDDSIVSKLEEDLGASFTSFTSQKFEI